MDEGVGRVVEEDQLRDGVKVAGVGVRVVGGDAVEVRRDVVEPKPGLCCVDEAEEVEERG